MRSTISPLGRGLIAWISAALRHMHSFCQKRHKRIIVVFKRHLPFPRPSYNPNEFVRVKAGHLMQIYQVIDCWTFETSPHKSHSVLSAFESHFFYIMHQWPNAYSLSLDSAQCESWQSTANKIIKLHAGLTALSAALSRRHLIVLC